MANQSKLKAWVRYDGTGRVISGGPIFQVNKPKVGNWKQIDANLCCNGGLTTTTTTTNGGGGVTPTAWVGQYDFDGPPSTWAWNVCNGFGYSTIVYTATDTAPFAPGTALYIDAALTTLFPESAAAISIQGTVYEIQNGYTNPLGGYGQPCGSITTSTTSTSTTQQVNSSSSFVFLAGEHSCNGGGTQTTIYWVGEFVENGLFVYLDSGLTQPVPFGTLVSTGMGQRYDVSNGQIFRNGSC